MNWCITLIIYSYKWSSDCLNSIIESVATVEFDPLFEKLKSSTMNSYLSGKNIWRSNDMIEQRHIKSLISCDVLWKSWLFRVLRCKRSSLSLCFKQLSISSFHYLHTLHGIHICSYYEVYDWFLACNNDINNFDELVSRENSLFTVHNPSHSS